MVGPDRAITNDDSAYASLGDYRSPLAADKENYDYYFPFLDLFSQKKLNPPTWKLTENPNTFSLSAQLPFNTNKYSLFSSADTSLPVSYTHLDVYKRQTLRPVTERSVISGS